jgi:lycopene cyclase domain-containing protein
MTYVGFLLRFLFIPILIFLAITYWDIRNNKQINGFKNGRAVWTAIGIHILLAVIYTTPWDNYLVATGVWYYNPDLVTGMVIGYVPIEEYTFFVVETILAGLWWWFLEATSPLPSPRERDSPQQKPCLPVLCVLVLLWLLYLSLLFGAASGPTSIILWALPDHPSIVFGRTFLAPSKLVRSTLPGTYLAYGYPSQEGNNPVDFTSHCGILFFGILPIEVFVLLHHKHVVTFDDASARTSARRGSRRSRSRSRRGKSGGCLIPSHVDEVVNPLP